MIKRFLKKLFWAIIIFIALDAAIVFAVTKFVPMEKIAAFVQDRVREQTGRDLAFSGVDFSFWPNISVELRQVTLSNPAGAQQKNMVSLGKAEVELELMPLLDHHIVVKRFVLNEPEIYLETSADGQQNWYFSQASPGIAGNNTAPPQRKSVAAPDSQGFDFRFGRIQIIKGKLIYADQQKNTVTSVEDVNIDVTLPDLKSPLQVKGVLTYRDKAVTLDMDLDRPLDFFNGRASSGQISMKTDIFLVKADGALALQGTLLKGDIEAATPHLTEALTWARNTPEQKLPFEKLSFSGEARMTKSDIILKEANLTLDDIQAKGSLEAGFTDKLDIFARLSMNKLNLDRFTGGGSASSASGTSGGAASEASSETGHAWDTRPLDFSGLKRLNADLKLQTQGFSLKGIDVGPSALAVQVQDGDLHFTSSEASLLGGKFSSDVHLNASRAVPTLALAFNMEGVQAQPVLATFAHFKKLSGAATSHVSLTAAGDTQEALISSLEGNGDADFKNGELEGIDLVKIARLVQEHSTNISVDEGETKFVDVTGTFAVMKGIISNTDLKMRGTVVQATGQGIIDLPKKYIEYKATPVLIVSRAPGTAPALSVPVKIKGPFNNIKVIPDFATTVRNIIKNPAAAKSALKNIGDNLKSLVGSNPAAALQNLLHGGSFKAPATAPAAPAPEAVPAPAPEQAPQPPESQPQPQQSEPQQQPLP